MKTSEIPQNAVRSCIKTYLHVNGMTYKDLAEKSGYTLNYISNCMSNFDITTKAIKKFSEALDYPYDLLVRGEQFYGTSALQKLEERMRKLEYTVAQLQQKIK